jgi:hypothetical protein
MFGGLAAGLEHRQHPVRNRIATGRIACPQQHGNKADNLLSYCAGVQEDQNTTDNDDAMHEVGA